MTKKLTDFSLRLKPTKKDLINLDRYKEFIKKRRALGGEAKVFTPEKKNAREIATLLAAGGVVAITWGEELRRIYCLICSHDNPEGPAIINSKIKGRPIGQPLGVGCLPEYISLIAHLRRTPGFMGSLATVISKKTIDITDEDILTFIRYIYQRNIGLIFYSKENFPLTALNKNNKSTILVVGQHYHNDDLDIYTPTLQECASLWGKYVLGSSANPTEEKVFSHLNHQEAYSFLVHKVDGLVTYDKVPYIEKIKRIINKAFGRYSLTSSTIIDLTEDKPILFRWGNTHPYKFIDIFPDLIIPQEVKKNIGAEEKIKLYERIHSWIFNIRGKKLHFDSVPP